MQRMITMSEFDKNSENIDEDDDLEYLINLYGRDILSSPGMQSEKTFRQHGRMSVYEHSLAVARMCLRIAKHFPGEVDIRSLVRGALLHDYFLYDWHIPDESHKWHGVTHAGDALKKAMRDFELNEIEQDMIRKHMFPLNPVPPKYRESWILCVADKICASKETIKRH